MQHCQITSQQQDPTFLHSVESWNLQHCHLGMHLVSALQETTHHLCIGTYPGQIQE
uniref:Protein LONGIFOLIA 1-like n=1 Tax=Rhizophora mucronata TaxID=61149 RepID=A0A2P2Q307_RHIMU